MELGEEAAHESQSIFCYFDSYSEQCLSRMCGHCAHSLLVLRSPQFSDCEVRAGHMTNLCWRYVCFSPTSKGQQHHLSQNIGLAIVGSARPAPPAMSERNEIIQVLKFKFQKRTEKVGWSRLPQPPRFRRPCENLPAWKRNTTMLTDLHWIWKRNLKTIRLFNYIWKQEPGMEREIECATEVKFYTSKLTWLVISAN